MIVVLVFFDICVMSVDVFVGVLKKGRSLFLCNFVCWLIRMLMILFLCSLWSMVCVVFFLVII